MARHLVGRFADRLVIGPSDGLTPRDVLACSGVVAVCRYGGAVRSSDSPWFEGPFGWVLAETVVLPRPVPCGGSQGLWPLPEDVLAAVVGSMPGFLIRKPKNMRDDDAGRDATTGPEVIARCRQTKGGGPR